jgi:hypothetical protein
MFIDEAQELLGEDYRLSGRTVDKMLDEVKMSLSQMEVQLD